MALRRDMADFASWFVHGGEEGHGEEKSRARKWGQAVLVAPLEGKNGLFLRDCGELRPRG